MKKNGFTLIEILAAIVIMGIVGAIGVVAISSNIVDARKSTTANLAKQLAESARNMRGQDKLPKDLKSGEALVIPCTKLTGTEIDLTQGTGFGDILYDYCYVGIVKENQSYSYYVTLIDTANYGYVGVEYEEISKDRIANGSDITLNPAINLGGTLSGFSNYYKGVTYNIKAARVKHDITTGGSIYGYYSNDHSSNVASQYNGTLAACDDILIGNIKTLNTSSGSYTIKSSEVDYLLLAK